MQSPFQLSLRQLILLVLLCACCCGICFWTEPALAIPLLVLPVCLIGERILQAGVVAEKGDEEAFSIRRLVIFLLSTVAPIYLASISCESGAPQVMSPFPFLVILPYFFGLKFVVTAIVILISYMLIFWPITRSRRGPIPLRGSILLVVATGLSVFWLGAGWSYGIQYQGLHYTRSVTIINVLTLVFLWTVWSVARRDSKFELRVCFGSTLFAWLFWMAFPYLGELP